MIATKAGYVYVLQMEGHSYYKIGRTVNITRRLGQISPQMPGRLIVVMAHRVMDAWRIESGLHGDFQQRRLNGEWFELQQIDLLEIEALLLADQAVQLYRNLLNACNNHSDPVRQTRALYHSALRMRRRQERYFDYSYDRDSRIIDSILNAEVVG